MSAIHPPFWTRVVARREGCLSGPLLSGSLHRGSAHRDLISPAAGISVLVLRPRMTLPPETILRGLPVKTPWNEIASEQIWGLGCVCADQPREKAARVIHKAQKRIEGRSKTLTAGTRWHTDSMP